MDAILAKKHIVHNFQQFIDITHLIILPKVVNITVNISFTSDKDVFKNAKNFETFPQKESRGLWRKISNVECNKPFVSRESIWRFPNSWMITLLLFKEAIIIVAVKFWKLTLLLFVYIRIRTRSLSYPPWTTRLIVQPTLLFCDVANIPMIAVSPIIIPSKRKFRTGIIILVAAFLPCCIPNPRLPKIKAIPVPKPHTVLKSVLSLKLLSLRFPPSRSHVNPISPSPPNIRHLAWYPNPPDPHHRRIVPTRLPVMVPLAVRHHSLISFHRSFLKNVIIFVISYALSSVNLINLHKKYNRNITLMLIYILKIVMNFQNFIITTFSYWYIKLKSCFVEK